MPLFVEISGFGILRMQLEQRKTKMAVRRLLQTFFAVMHIPPHVRSAKMKYSIMCIFCPCRIISRVIYFKFLLHRMNVWYISFSLLYYKDFLTFLCGKGAAKPEASLAKCAVIIRNRWVTNSYLWQKANRGEVSVHFFWKQLFLCESAFRSEDQCRTIRKQWETLTEYIILFTYQFSTVAKSNEQFRNRDRQITKN